MQLFFRDANSSGSLDLNQDASLIDLKSALENAAYFNSENQFLLFNGTVLDGTDGQLQDLGINNLSSIDICDRLLGGKGKQKNTCNH